MSSVTQRIKEIKQPRGGYINPNSMIEEKIPIGKLLSYNENIPPNIIGLTVDYMLRFLVTNDINSAFDISLKGAMNASLRMDFLDAELVVEELLNQITGVNDNSIISACKMCTFDTFYRSPRNASVTAYMDVNPNEDTIENIRVMIERALKVFDIHGECKKYGFDFLPNGYTDTVTNGDGDFLTNDTLWDIKVSKYKPTKENTLQIAIYYIMGKHSGQKIFNDIHNIGILNPRLSKAYIIDMNEVPDEIIRTIENEVICY